MVDNVDEVLEQVGDADEAFNEDDEEPEEDGDNEGDDANDDDFGNNGDDDDGHGPPAIIENDDDDDDYNNANDDDDYEDQGANHEAHHYENQGANDERSQEGGHDEVSNSGGDDDADNEESPRYYLRERKPAGSSFKHAMDQPHGSKSYFPPTQLTQRGFVDTIKLIYGKVMTQMTAEKGIKEFGQEAIAALMTEFSQLENHDVYEVLDAGLLTIAQRRGALRAINLIKRKRNGTLKGRTVADGSVQRSLYAKSETALMRTKDGMLQPWTCAAGAYLKAFIDDLVIMKFTGELVNILCKMNPKHLKFVVVENGAKVLYVRLIKTLYGCVKSALLWYKLFSTTLKGMGFELNPYDPCIANCKIDGKQSTVAWYGDDNKISHVDPNVVTRIIEQIEGHFGKMTVTRGEEHTFLGMNITYTKAGANRLHQHEELS